MSDQGSGCQYNFRALGLKEKGTAFKNIKTISIRFIDWRNFNRAGKESCLLFGRTLQIDLREGF